MRTRRNQSKKSSPPAHRVAHTQPATGHERLVVSTLAGMALLAASPASHSLSLGEITVHSSLGQRLDASVPVQLAMGESLASGCIQSARTSNELGRVPEASVSTPEAVQPGTYTLRISSAAALYEPIYALNLQAGCPGTAAITRQYVLMLDPPGMTADPAETPFQPPVTQAERLPEALPASLVSADALRTTVPRERPLRSRRSLDAADTPVLPGTSYQVVAGDTVSSIAARVSGRRVNLWTLAGQIFAANPDAFIRNDINLIKLGSTINIPANDATTGEMIPAALTAPLPERVPVPLPEPALLPTVAPVPVEPAPATASTTEIAATPAADTALVGKIVPVTESATRPAEPAIAAVDTAAETEASPLAATAAGISFGLLISAFLWFRNRLPAIARKRPEKQPMQADSDVEEDPFSSAAIAAPIAVRTERAEPSITVQWSARPDDSLSKEFTRRTGADPQPQTAAPLASAAHSEEITSELEKLFGDDSETLTSPAPAMPSMPNDDNKSARDAGANDKQAETLLQALSLLERDYEAELTASQVLDLSAMREALATGTDSTPFIKKPD